MAGVAGVLTAAASERHHDARGYPTAPRGGVFGECIIVYRPPITSTSCTPPDGCQCRRLFWGLGLGTCVCFRELSDVFDVNSGFYCHLVNSVSAACP